MGIIGWNGEKLLDRVAYLVDYQSLMETINSQPLDSGAFVTNLRISSKGREKTPNDVQCHH